MRRGDEYVGKRVRRMQVGRRRRDRPKRRWEGCAKEDTRGRGLNEDIGGNWKPRTEGSGGGKSVLATPIDCDESLEKKKKQRQKQQQNG